MATLADDLPATALSLEQRRESLWADARHRVYALMVTARVPGLRERLARGDVDDWDGLWTGELDARLHKSQDPRANVQNFSSFNPLNSFNISNLLIIPH